MHIRQGDVLVIQNNNVKAEEQGKAVLAFGEVSGHSHTIKDVRFKSGRNGLAKAVIAEQEALLEHQEHDAQKLVPQSYEVRLQRRVDVLGEVRRVMD